jgi:hypothetical protein
MITLSDIVAAFLTAIGLPVILTVIFNFLGM